ncbi:MAG: hypothetical protein ACRDLZ_05125 [Gaiellaceae bacterium]
MHESHRTRSEASAPVRVGWETLHYLELSVRSIEDGATRVIAAQVAGLIALWTQLGNFENGPPEVLAWASWAVLAVSIVGLGVVTTPDRVTRFWTRLSNSVPSVNEPLDEAAELALIEDLSDALRAQRKGVHRALQAAIALSLAALVLVGLAYVAEKAFYAP